MRRLGISGSWSEVFFGASVGAAAIHLAAARPHFDEWALAGTFMLACGLAQLGSAFWLVVRPRAAAVGAGVGLNAGIVTVWGVSRTVGLPFGPAAGMREHVHPADALATGLEVLAIVAAFALVFGWRPRRLVFVVAGAAAAAAVLSGAHDRGREGLTAAAALAVASVAHRLTQSPKARRDHVRASIVHGIGAARRAARRALGAAGGRGASARRHRHLEQPGV